MIPKRFIVPFRKKIRMIAPRSQMPASMPIRTIIRLELSAYS
jgi:hypothetical protein